jgi:predicted SAM-dependent methyltransferase
MRELLGQARQRYLRRRSARRLAAEREAAHAKLRDWPQPYRVHLGCGPVRLEGWVNVDRNPRFDSVDIVWDLSHGIPVPDLSSEYVYHEHLLEHLSAEDGVAFLRECRRVLQPGGVLRVAMPSLDFVLEKVSRGDWRDQAWLAHPKRQSIRTRAEMLNKAFRGWGHQWLYDREELHRRLQEAGFEKIRDVERGESPAEALRGLETREDSLLVCEAER